MRRLLRRRAGSRRDRFWRPATLVVLGVALTIVTAWGAIFWRVCVSRPFLRPGEGTPASLREWPLPAPQGWPERPQFVEVTRDLGYERRVASGVQSLVRRTDVADAPWVDSTEYHDRRLRLLRRRLDDPTGAAARAEVSNPPLQTVQTHYEVFRRRSGFPFRGMESSWREATQRTYTQSTAGGLASAPTAAPPWPPIPAPASPDGQGWTWRMHYHRGVPWPQSVALPNAGGARFNLPLKPVWPQFALNVLFWAAAPVGLLRACRWQRRHRRVGRGQCPGCGYPIGAAGVCSECGALLPIRADSIAPVAQT